MSTWRFLLHRLTEKLWIRAALYAGFGIAMALLAALFSGFVPDSLAKPFGGGTVTGLMNILASSLLAVATFSVTALLAAFTNISSGATPRAAVLVAGNGPAQGALATFVGAFLYAVVGYSALGTGYYAEGGRAILFFVTLIMLAIVAVTLLRWLDHLLHLARVDNAITAVELETAKAIDSVFGAQAPHTIDSQPPRGVEIIEAGSVGYVQNVDVEALRELAKKHGLSIWIEAAPGCLTLSDTVLASIAGRPDRVTVTAIREAFTLDVERSFRQDPQFGFIVLGEIAAKALSPGINNPGVAKDVITSVVRLLEQWMRTRRAAPCVAPGPVYWRGPTFETIVEDALLPVATNGSTAVTVAIRLQNVLSALHRSANDADRRVLVAFALESLTRSKAGIDHEPDFDRIRRAATDLADAKANLETVTGWPAK